MTSHVKSVIKRGSKTINMQGFRDSIVNHSNDTYHLNEYVGKIFFDDENYRSIIECLNGGHDVSTDLIEFMQEYLELLQNYVRALISYFNKSKSKLKHQPSISSYYTTKRAQMQTIKASEGLAKIIEARCDAIQHVINAYKKQIDRMYPNNRFKTTRKHYRTDEMKKSFKNAHSSLSTASDKVKVLREQAKKAQTALHEADVLCENLGLDSTTSQSKLTTANDKQKKRRNELADIEQRINLAEEIYDKEKTIYRTKATDIFKQCQELEKERLDQIRETLLAFIEAIHTSEYSDQLDSIYGDLLTNIETQQNSNEDLKFWIQTYGVDTLMKSSSTETDEDDDDTVSRTTVESRTTSRNTKKSQINETNTSSPAKIEEQKSVVEDEEDEDEQSTAAPTTTPAKTKGKKNKGKTATDKNNNSTTE